MIILYIKGFHLST